MTSSRIQTWNRRSRCWPWTGLSRNGAPSTTCKGPQATTQATHPGWLMELASSEPSLKTCRCVPNAGIFKGGRGSFFAFWQKTKVHPLLPKKKPKPRVYLIFTLIVKIKSPNSGDRSITFKAELKAKMPVLIVVCLLKKPNFGELLKWVLLFENNSEIGLHFGSKTRLNSGQ